MKSRALECQFLSDDMSGVSLVERTISDPSEKEILIAIKASSVNFPDYLMTQGKYQHKPELPFGLGMEGSGIVKKTGNGVSNSKLAMKLPLEHWEKVLFLILLLSTKEQQNLSLATSLLKKQLLFKQPT